MVKRGSKCSRFRDQKKQTLCDSGSQPYYVIVGANPINKARRTVLVVPLSCSAKISPPIVVNVIALGQSVGAICDQIRAADKSRFSKHPDGTLSEGDMLVIDESLKKVLAI